MPVEGYLFSRPFRRRRHGGKRVTAGVMFPDEAFDVFVAVTFGVFFGLLVLLGG